MPGFQAGVHKLESLVNPPKASWPGSYKNVQCCGGLSLAFQQLKDPLKLFVKRRDFQVSILSGYDLSC